MNTEVSETCFLKSNLRLPFEILNAFLNRKLILRPLNEKLCAELFVFDLRFPDKGFKMISAEHSSNNGKN